MADLIRAVRKPTHSGTVTSDFQFASGYHDSQTGMLKFGARYYDPTLGRWTQADPIAGNFGDPKTLNRYAYVGCNPVNATDPSGWGCDFATAVAILLPLLTTFELEASVAEYVIAAAVGLSTTIAGVVVSLLLLGLAATLVYIYIDQCG